MLQLDPTDQRLLGLLQEPFPLVERPFAVFGQELGLTEGEVLARVGKLRNEVGVIRQISAIFDSRALGYQSMLVAARVAGDKLEAAAGMISGHPGVSHNYQRNHAYNLWFTLALPPDSRLGLEKTLEILRETSGAEEVHALPAIKTYKIGVKFELGDEAGAEIKAETKVGAKKVWGATPARVVDAGERKLIRVLQQDLPIESQPFTGWAVEAGVGVADLLMAAEKFQQEGLMRRFSAVLKHRAAGISANAMGVWVVPEEGRDEFGKIAAGFAAVSHCYARPTFGDWPYSLFTMVHAKTVEQGKAVLAAISTATGITAYDALYSSREFKKVRVKYFVGDIEAWEQAHS